MIFFYNYSAVIPSVVARNLQQITVNFPKRFLAMLGMTESDR